MASQLERVVEEKPSVNMSQKTKIFLFLNLIDWFKGIRFKGKKWTGEDGEHEDSSELRTLEPAEGEAPEDVSAGSLVLQQKERQRQTEESLKVWGPASQAHRVAKSKRPFLKQDGRLGLMLEVYPLWAHAHIHTMSTYIHTHACTHISMCTHRHTHRVGEQGIEAERERNV